MTIEQKKNYCVSGGKSGTFLVSFQRRGKFFLLFGEYGENAENDRGLLVEDYGIQDVRHRQNEMTAQTTKFTKQKSIRIFSCFCLKERIFKRTL